MEYVTVESDSREAERVISLTVIPVIRIGGRRTFRGSIRERRYLDVTNEQLPGAAPHLVKQRARTLKKIIRMLCSGKFSN